MSTRGRSPWRGSNSSSRGRWSTNNYSYGHPNSHWRQQTEAAARPPSPDLGAVVTKIQESDLHDSSEADDVSPMITDVKDLASYNWINKSTPTIMVPGKPPRWTPPTIATQLQEDSRTATYFRDPNAARYPQHPIQPAVQAIFQTDPTFPTWNIDIFTCSSSLSRLLMFVRKIDARFRILVEVIGDTIFFVRRENEATEAIPAVYGYGHTFPEAYTSWDSEVRGSESCQRLVRYTFDGMECVVRFESDGYLPSLLPPKSKSGGNRQMNVKDEGEEGLLKALGGSSISTAASAKDKPLTVLPGGDDVPQQAVFDLKTRTIRKKEQEEEIIAEQLSRLWVSQTPNFVLAYHRQGKFEDIEIKDLRNEVDEWESENEEVLRRFAVLLRKICNLARNSEDGRIEIRRCEGQVGVLEIREPGGEVGDALSREVRERWVRVE